MAENKFELNKNDYYLIDNVSLSASLDNIVFDTAPFLCSYVGEDRLGYHVFEIIYNEDGLETEYCYDGWPWPNENIHLAPKELIEKYETIEENYN